jgi:carboxymethylenebutenolidase
MPNVFDQGYLALPTTETSAPAVLVLPAWWGLNPFFEQLCDRLAQSGFVAFAPDVYEGKTAGTVAEAEALSSALDKEKADNMIHNAAIALRQHPRTNGKPVGVIGFSMGAAQGLKLLKVSPDQIGALVLFYGTYPMEFPTMNVPVLGHFAETDDYESPDDQQALVQALKAAGAEVTFQSYPDTGHWFFESNQPNAYKADAANLAWERTIEFLKARL